MRFPFTNLATQKSIQLPLIMGQEVELSSLNDGLSLQAWFQIQNKTSSAQTSRINRFQRPGLKTNKTKKQKVDICPPLTWKVMQSRWGGGGGETPSFLGRWCTASSPCMVSWPLRRVLRKNNILPECKKGSLLSLVLEATCEQGKGIKIKQLWVERKAKWPRRSLGSEMEPRHLAKDRVGGDNSSPPPPVEADK